MLLSIWATLLISKVEEILSQSDEQQSSAYVYLRKRSNFNYTEYICCCTNKEASRLRYEMTSLHLQLEQVNVVSQRSYAELDHVGL